MSASKGLLSTVELARAVGHPLIAVYDAIRHGRVSPPAKVGRTYLWGSTDVAEVKAVMDQWASRKGVARG